MFSVYVIKSLKDERFYIGQTENTEERLIKHNKGLVESTKNRKPFVLIFQEKFESRKEAIHRERYLKSLKGGNEFKKILNNHCGVV